MVSPMLQRVLGGRFRLESMLGQGGMGSVFAATDTSINRLVAVKLLRRELTDDSESLERLREEATSLAALRHPNVVQLYDFYTSANDSTFLVMELVDGESLAQRLHRQGSLPVAVAVDYSRQVLSALSAAHAKGIVHRDIKPGNVLVAPVPMQRDLVKVLDFGIAKLTEETIRRRPTTAGILLGTPSFMSPEQAMGHPVDARSDIYAAGLLLYTMLAGKNPFSGIGDVAATLVRVQSVMPPAIDRVRPDVPAALAEVIAVAMAKAAGQRFQTAAELVQALDWAVASAAQQTGTVSRVQPAPHPAMIAPVPTTVAGPTVGPRAGELAPVAPFPIPRQVPPRPRSLSTGAVVAIVALAVFGCVLVVSVGYVTVAITKFLTAVGAAPAWMDAAPPAFPDEPQ